MCYFLDYKYSFKLKSVLGYFGLQVTSRGFSRFICKVYQEFFSRLNVKKCLTKYRA